MCSRSAAYRATSPNGSRMVGAMSCNHSKPPSKEHVLQQDGLPVRIQQSQEGMRSVFNRASTANARAAAGGAGRFVGFVWASGTQRSQQAAKW